MIKKAMLAGIALVFIVVGYYTLSPLFRNIAVDDQSPTLITEKNGEEIVEENVTWYPILDTPLHPASGKLRVVHSEGKTYVRYEDYKTINGPDLFVYLSKDLEATDFVNLGEIRGTEGNINYEIPEGINIDEYRYVLTWCKQFGVLFNSVDLKGNAEVLSQELENQTQSDEGEIKEDGEGTANVVIQNALPKPEVSGPQKVIMGTGCFWCVEHDFAKVEGVLDVVSGYAGGISENPTYKNYADSGHREVVEVTYNPEILSYGNIVEHTIKYGDPTDGGGSFYDRGEEYAPVIHYANEWERQEAEVVIARIDALKVYKKPIDIDVVPATKFWPAEEYHQDYAEKNAIKYNYYRLRSGRTAFIEKYWGENAGAFVASPKPKANDMENKAKEQGVQKMYEPDSWSDFNKPTETVLRGLLTPLQYTVTQENGTESPFANAYDKNYEEGIYVDIVSGEPLYFSKDKYDSGTGWPSFVKPISLDVVTLHEDNTLFSKRTEVRSRFADSHLGHVFDDGPKDRGGKRYCMNSASLRFIPKSEMEQEGYAYLLKDV